MKIIPTLLFALFLSNFFIACSKSDEERCREGELDRCAKALIEKGSDAAESLKKALDF